MYEIKEKEKSRMAHFSNLIDCEDKVITCPTNRRIGPTGRRKAGVQTQRIYPCL